VLAEIEPFFDRLLFYPITGAPPQGASILQRALRATRQQLSRMDDPRQVGEMRRAFAALPLYDRLVSLYLETVEDEWPCQVYPSDWHARASALLSELPPRVSGEGFPQLAARCSIACCAAGFRLRSRGTATDATSTH
jgi:hypothetical protein